MNVRHVVIGIAWIASLALAAGWTSAQTSTWTPLTEPVIKSGEDVGFRIEWLNGRTPYGRLVIRQNGQWIEARIGAPGDRQVLPAPPPVPVPPAPPRQ